MSENFLLYGSGSMHLLSPNPIPSKPNIHVPRLHGGGNTISRFFNRNQNRVVPVADEIQTAVANSNIEDFLENLGDKIQAKKEELRNYLSQWHPRPFDITLKDLQDDVEELQRQYDDLLRQLREEDEEHLHGGGNTISRFFNRNRVHPQLSEDEINEIWDEFEQGRNEIEQGRPLRQNEINRLVRQLQERRLTEDQITDVFLEGERRRLVSIINPNNRPEPLPPGGVPLNERHHGYHEMLRRGADEFRNRNRNLEDLEEDDEYRVYPTQAEVIPWADANILPRGGRRRRRRKN